MFLTYFHDVYAREHLNLASFANIFYSTVRYQGSSSSIKCHVCHHVGEKTHTRGLQRD